jgi:hypothetical protein
MDTRSVESSSGFGFEVPYITEDVGPPPASSEVKATVTSSGLAAELAEALPARSIRGAEATERTVRLSAPPSAATAPRRPPTAVSAYREERHPVPAKLRTRSEITRLTPVHQQLPRAAIFSRSSGAMIK